MLYLGLAHGDAESRQLRAYRMFSPLGCDVTALPFFPYEMKRDYVALGHARRRPDLRAGDTTPAMIAVWREFGFDRELRAAW